MAETKYTSEQIDALMAADDSLRRTTIEKFTDYKSKDPFPKVGEALLNSADLLMYILTVGIVEPFCVDNLKGVTYACTFSGEAHYYDIDKQKMKVKILNDGEELELEQNSITYLKIEEKFHVPEYMVLRFNLSVSNAYKGVLLGTGPIVDPGFEGSLFIPLHNLTGNKYTIKKGAPLIRVEFTKLSCNSEWKAPKVSTKTIPSSIKPITKMTPHNATFDIFIEDALLDSEKKMFYTNGISVRSSIPDVIKKSAEQAETAAKQAAEAEQVVNKIKKFGIVGSVIAVIGVVVAVFSLLIPTWQAFYSFSKERNEYRDTISQYQKTIEELEYRLTTLKIDDIHEEIDLLQEKLNLLLAEYTVIDDENSVDAKNINDQINRTKEQIATLEKNIVDLQRQID